MNCKWRGPKLRDILLRAGISTADPEGQHAAFACHSAPVQGGEDWVRFLSSIGSAESIVNLEKILSAPRLRDPT